MTVRVDGGAANQQRPCWGWNGSLTAPTFTPSINVWPEGRARWGYPRCHSFITDGRIQFLGDCEHELAGQTVALGPHEWD